MSQCKNHVGNSLFFGENFAKFQPENTRIFHGKNGPNSPDFKSKKLFACRTSRNHEQNPILRFLCKPQKRQELCICSGIAEHAEQQNGFACRTCRIMSIIIKSMWFLCKPRTTTRLWIGSGIAEHAGHQKLFCLQEMQKSWAESFILCKPQTRKTKLVQNHVGHKKDKLVHRTM